VPTFAILVGGLVRENCAKGGIIPNGLFFYSQAGGVNLG
jgi:hypothetical protein